MKSICSGVFVILYFFVQATSAKYLPFAPEGKTFLVNALIAAALSFIFIGVMDLGGRVHRATKGAYVIAAGVAFHVIAWVLGSANWLSLPFSGTHAEKLVASLIYLMLVVAPALIFLKTVGSLMILIGLIQVFASVDPVEPAHDSVLEER